MDSATLLVYASRFALDRVSILCDGMKVREKGDGKPFVSGYDAPELKRAYCHEERRPVVEERKARAFWCSWRRGVGCGFSLASIAFRTHPESRMY